MQPPPPSMPPGPDDDGAGGADETSLPQIGGFRVLRRLASGGTADIFLARAGGPHGFERVVVLKVLLQRFRNDPSFERMFAREASAYARLSHPAIVRLFDFFSTDGQLVMVLEHVDGLPLNKLRAMLSITGDKLDDRAALFVASRVFAALAAAHTAKDPETGEFAPVIHRDINPSNVLVPWDGHVKLADFGIAKVTGMQGDTKTGFIKGTYGYMAPEQVRGEAVTGRADVYAATLLLWELLTRRKAIQRGALPEVEVLKAMAKPQFPSLDSLRPELDPAVRDAVRRGLEPIADRRSITAEDMATILRTAMAGAAGSEEARLLLMESLARVRPAPSADLDVTQARLRPSSVSSEAETVRSHGPPAPRAKPPMTVATPTKPSIPSPTAPSPTAPSPTASRTALSATAPGTAPASSGTQPFALVPHPNAAAGVAAVGFSRTAAGDPQSSTLPFGLASKAPPHTVASKTLAFGPVAIPRPKGSSPTAVPSAAASSAPTLPGAATPVLDGPVSSGRDLTPPPLPPPILVATPPAAYPPPAAAAPAPPAPAPAPQPEADSGPGQGRTLVSPTSLPSTAVAPTVDAVDAVDQRATTVAGPNPLRAERRSHGRMWALVLLLLALVGGTAVGYFGFVWRPHRAAVAASSRAGHPVPAPPSAAVSGAQSAATPVPATTASAAAAPTATPLTSGSAATAATPPTAGAAVPTSTSSAAPPSSGTSAASAAPGAAPSGQTAAAPSADGGDLVVSGSPGHRVYVDGRVVGQSPGTFHVKCGTRSVHIGSSQAPKSLKVPCGASVEL